MKIFQLRGLFWCLFTFAFSMTVALPAADLVEPESANAIPDNFEDFTSTNEEGLPGPAIPAEAQTTPKPRTPMAFENKTSSLIVESSGAMEDVQIELLKYETQINFNTLDNLIPILDEIQKNMTELLHSKSTDGNIFEQQSQFLETELVEVERQIKLNRELQTHYQEIQESLREQFGAVNNSLGSLLNSQVYIFGYQQRNSSAGPKSADEIKLHIQHVMFSPSLRMVSAEIISAYLESLDKPEHRYVGYSTFLESNPFNKSGYINMTLVRNIYRFPELDSLKENIPPMLRLIFSENKKIIRKRYYSSFYTLAVSGGEPTVVSFEAESNRRWMFYPVEGTEFFHIVDTITNMAVGMILKKRSYYSSEVNTMAVLQFDEVAKVNRRFQWRILAGADATGKIFFAFSNVETLYTMQVDGSTLAAHSSLYFSFTSPASDSSWELM